MKLNDETKMGKTTMKSWMTVATRIAAVYAVLAVLSAVTGCTDCSDPANGRECSESILFPGNGGNSSDEGTGGGPSTETAGTSSSTEPGDCGSDPGDDVGGARDVGVLADGSREVCGYVGADYDDESDYFRFELDEAATVTVVTRDVTGRVRVDFYQESAAFREDAPFLTHDSVDDSERSLTLRLPRGQFLARVAELNSGYRANTYTVAFNTEAYLRTEENPEAGNDRDASVDLGALPDGTPVTFAGYVGTRPSDEEDYYEFSLDEAATVTFTTEDTLGRVYVFLYEDTSTFSENVYVDLHDSEDDTERSNTRRLPAGDYLIRVAPRNGNYLANLYTVTVNAVPYATTDGESNGDDDRTNAHDLGAFDGAPLTAQGYVGTQPSDEEDYYRIDLAEDADLIVTTRDVVGRVYVQVYEDDAAFREDDALGPLHDSQDDAERSTPFRGLQAGSYLVRVTQRSDGYEGSLYTLALTLEQP